MGSQAVNFDDLGAKNVAPPGGAAAAPQRGIDFSYLGGKLVSPAPARAPIPVPVAPSSIPKTLANTTPMADPGAGTTYQEPETKGPLHQIGGFLQGAGENVAGAVKGIHGLFQEPQNEEEKAVQQKLMVGDQGQLGGRLALAGYRFLHGINDTLNQSDKAAQAAAAAKKQGEGIPGQILADVEQEPIVGNAAKLAEQGEYGKALGDLLTSVVLLRGGQKGAGELSKAGEAAKAAIPAPEAIAGTTLPESVGQAAARANPAGVGTDIKGVEDVARRIPGSEGLRKLSTEQQTAARDILAKKATTATGAPTSTAAESIEQNAANAAEAARTAGSAKYEEIGQAARNADLTPTVEAAHSILQDETILKVLPKSARDALGKVASSLTERETIARQIYGKAFADLDDSQKAEVGKATAVATPSTGFANILKARSELADAANGMKDAADRFQMHKALDRFDEAVNKSLAAHDAAQGTNLTSTLGEAKQLWSQKYAFEEFRDRLQDIMRDQPYKGNREINGASFQKVVNDLDPRGSKGVSILQRMFPGDAQSVKDLHDLADFMGRTQAGAGGMASGFAKLRILGLKESAIGLIANTAGFSYLLSRPGLARAMLTALKGGKDVTKVSAAVGEINHAANLSPTQATPEGGTEAQIPEGRIAVAIPTGQTYHFPSQEAADAFKKNAGLQ